jgi:hypothetical protein
MGFKEDKVADKDVFRNPDEFDETFVFSRTGLTKSAGFHNNYVTAEDVETSDPFVKIYDDDYPGIVHGDTLTRVDTSQVYNVIGVHPDGTGYSDIVLSVD